MVDVTDYTYPFDRTGKALSNKVGPERHTLDSVAWTDYNIAIPKFAPFFTESMKVFRVDNGEELIQGVDWVEMWYFDAASGEIGARIYGGLLFYDNEADYEIELREYQTIGGPWTLDAQGLAKLLATKLLNPILTRWEQVVELPFEFPPLDHEHDVTDLTTLQDLLDKLESIRQAILTKTGANLDLHIADHNNPHVVTKDHVNLGLVMNYPMAQLADIALDKLTNSTYMNPPMTAELIRLIAIAALNSHINDKNDPHDVTKAQVGLSLVDNFATAGVDDIVAGATATNKFTTPNIVEAMITAIALAALGQHTSDFANPHRTSAGQVGAFTKQETIDRINQALAGAGGSLDAATLQGSSLQQVIDNVLNQTNTLINNAKPGIVNDVVAIVSQQTAPDSLKLGGLTSAEWDAKIANASSDAGLKAFFPPLADTTETYTRIATFSPVKDDINIQGDIMVFITGGNAPANTSGAATELLITSGDITKCRANAMSDAPSDSTFYGVDLMSTLGYWEIWMRSPAKRKGVNLFTTNSDYLLIADTVTVQATAPAGAVLFGSDTFAKESTVSALLTGMTTAFNNASALLDA